MRNIRKALLVSVAATLTISAPSQANDFAAGVITGIVGTMVVDAIAKGSANSNQPTRAAAPRQPTAAEIARAAELERERERNRNVQTWLTVLGFDPGGVDGRVGPNTTRAIRDFQASLNEPQTGDLTPNQEVLLYNFAVGAPVQIDAAAPGNAFPATEGGVTPAVGSPPNAASRPVVTTNLPAPTQLPGDVAMSASFEGGQTVSAQIAPPPPVTVLGIRPEMPLDQARQQLSERGYADCQDGDGSLICSKGAQDAVLVGYSLNGNETQVHTVARTVKLAAPVPRAALLEELKAPYPELINAPEMAAASSPDCFEAGRPIRSADYAQMKSWIGSGGAPEQDIRSFASNCLYHYSVGIAETTEVDGFTIALFAGGPILATLTEGQVSSPLQGLSF